MLMEPSGAGVEAGCQGTLRADVRTAGRRAHSARSWLGTNAIHAAGDVLDRLRTYVPREPDVDGLRYHEDSTPCTSPAAWPATSSPTSAR